MNLRRRFFAEAILAAAFALLFVVTLFWPDWIELAFGVDPDGGDGSLEWELVAIFALVTLCCATLARMEWRRARPSQREATNVR